MKNKNWYVYIFLSFLFLVETTEKTFAATNEDLFAQLETSSLRFVLYSPTAKHFELVISRLTQTPLKKQSLALIAEAFPLPDPPRLVVDVVGYSSPVQKSVQVKHEHVQALRVGVHRKKTRLVIDFQGSLPAQYHVHNKQDDQTTVSFDFGGTPEKDIPLNSNEEDAKKNGKVISETTSLQEQSVHQGTEASSQSPIVPQIEKPQVKDLEKSTESEKKAPTFDNEISLDPRPRFQTKDGTPLPQNTASKSILPAENLMEENKNSQQAPSQHGAIGKNNQKTGHSQARDNETKELAALLNEVSRSTSPLPPEPEVSPKSFNTTVQSENRKVRKEKTPPTHHEPPENTSKENREESNRPETVPHPPHIFPSKHSIPEPSPMVKSQKAIQSIPSSEGPVDVQEKKEEEGSSRQRASDTERTQEEQKEREKESPGPEKLALATTEPQSTQGAVVKSIVFRPVDNGSSAALVINADHLGSYSLVRKNDEMYELLLEKIHFKGTHLSLPQFPPDTFQGFQVVVASQRGDNVVVKIYVENRVTLSPSRSGEDLIVRVVSEK